MLAILMYLKGEIHCPFNKNKIKQTFYTAFVRNCLIGWHIILCKNIIIDKKKEKRNATIWDGGRLG